MTFSHKQESEQMDISIPDGYVLVPIEPTDSMLVAARRDTGIGANAAYHVYKAMISSALKGTAK